MAKKKYSKENVAAATNGETDETNNATTQNNVKTINTAMFQRFQELTNEEDDVRLNAIFQLVQQLDKTDDNEKNQKTLLYALKRLIRGCGASTNISRAGFYTGLVTFLKVNNGEKISLQQICKTLEAELSVGATIANKEDADAIVGRILTCGALIQSNRLEDAEAEHLELTLNILLQAAKHRTYHSSLAFAFIVKLIEKLPIDKFKNHIWPILSKEIIKPWPKQTIQTIHCLIAIQNKFPKILNGKNLSTNIDGTKLLNEESYQHLYRIFWKNNNTQILTHPAFESFGIYIANSSNLIDFWQTTVDAALEQPTKLLELVSLKVATDILMNMTVKDGRVIDLFSKNFMKMLIDGLKNQKQKKDETLKAFFNEFMEALVAATEKLTNDDDKVTIIRRLILSPGIFDIEKYTNTRIVHQMINFLDMKGVLELFEIFKNVFMAVLPKNPENPQENWLNFERINAGYMLQHLLSHRAVNNAHSWREKQLKFLFTVGIFHVNDKLEITKEETASTFSVEYGGQCKNMFYASLQVKLGDLKEEKKMLYNLVNFCNEILQQKNTLNYFRIKEMNKETLSVWKEMISALEVAGKFDQKSEALSRLNLVFHILLLNMGLLLFHDAEMAAPTIKDLMICITRIRLQQKTKKSSSKTVENGDEPQWIEVVVDLLLHLLSQNSVALRNIVNAIFPHLCDHLTLNALHQMFGVLDMQDGANPLTNGNDDSDQSDDDDEDDEEKEENDKEESDDNSSDEYEESDQTDDDDEDEPTANDQLRNAVSQALIDSNINDNLDDDMASVDLNDLTEEEGQLIDKALANAFKAMRKSSTGNGNIKKSKSYRVKTTTLMHFRIRVLDLIEIYLQQKPALFIAIEIMQTLFAMLENCTSEELKPLQNKLTKVLNKLTTQKTYRIDADADLTEDSIVAYIRQIAEKKLSAPVYELSNKLRNKCIIFLLHAAQMIAPSAVDESGVLCVLQEYLQEFIKSRNPIVNVTLFMEIFKLRWNGIWKLATTLTKDGLALTTRVFRRIQAIEILILLYKNNELQKLDADVTRTKLLELEKAVQVYIETLANIESDKRSSKEFQTLNEFLAIARKCNQRLNLTSTLNSIETQNAIQSMRRCKVAENGLKNVNKMNGHAKIPKRKLNNEIKGNDLKKQKNN